MLSLNLKIVFKIVRTSLSFKTLKALKGFGNTFLPILMKKISSANLGIGWTTCSTEKDAKTIAHKLVTENLAICAQISGPIASIFNYDGKLCEDTEHKITLKFLKEKELELSKHLHQIHPYEVPQWVSVTADTVGEDYLKWAQNS